LGEVGRDRHERGRGVAPRARGWSLMVLGPIIFLSDTKGATDFLVGSSQAIGVSSTSCW
jgi:hypothetical protein